MQERLTPHRVALGISLLWTAFAAVTLGGFGLTSDSPSLFYAGDRHLFWLLHMSTPGSLNFFGPDPSSFHSAFFRFPEQADPFHYPVFPGFVAAVVSAVFSNTLGWMGAIDGHHFGLALLQSVNLYVFARYAISLFGLATGGSATLMLAFFPCILGHAINNAKDLPCALLYGTLLMAGARGLLRRSPKDLLLCGLIAGVALDCKLNAVFALITLVFWTPVAYLSALRRSPLRGRWLWVFLGVTYGVPLAALLMTDFAPSRSIELFMALCLTMPTLLDVVRVRSQLTWGLAGAYAAIPFIAAFTFVALWPWLWAGQGGTFVQRLSLYADGMIRFSVSPRPGFTDYPLRCLAFMTPPLILALALGGLATGWRGAVPRRSLYVLILMWIGLPLGRIAIPHSMFYDANRHFLEYIPPLCMLAGLGVAFAIGWLRQLPQPKLRRLALGGLAGIGVLALAIPISTYHPFEVTYFNWLAGGLGGAQRDALLYVPGEDWRSPGTEGDYWHASIRDFLKHVGPVVPMDSLISTCGTMYIQAIANWTGPRLHFVDRHDEGDYLYAAPRESFCSWADIRDLESQRPVLLRVRRDGGLIYEILGPPVPYPLPSVSPRTAYDPPLVLLPPS
jgi:Dolichyl-phosphate-mannose-protein mannosyltransferase